MDGDGQVQSFGRLEKLGKVMHGLEEERMLTLQQELAIENEGEDMEEIDLENGNSPTTLMLFNIFTPDEVDFLSALVGDDAVKELRDDASNDKIEEGTEKPIKYGPNFETNKMSSTQGRPVLPEEQQKQQYDTKSKSESNPKNVNPSSQEVGHQVSNIHERLEIYSKPEYNITGDHLEEEGKFSHFQPKESKYPTRIPQMNFY